MSSGPAPAQLDLEKELTCSICTDILYQPLTLLDCLHTFCGACLKEWFRSQAQRATSLHPYTCPACRSSVRATKHNASIATLLDMYLQMNPTKSRTQEERDDLQKIYKPGDNVLPKLRRRGRRTDDEEDQRVLNDVMTLSLQDAGISEPGASHSRHNRRDRASRERRRSPRAAPRAGEPRQAGLYLHGRDEPRVRNMPAGQPEVNVDPVRSLDHQSSLRSLLSVSESDVEEEILRQIMEDGVLNGVDLSNMTTAQEDELTERIAVAYRRRQEEQRRTRRASQRQDEPATARTMQRSRDRSRRSSRVRHDPDQSGQQDNSTRSSVDTTSPIQAIGTLRVVNGTDADGTVQQNGSRHRSASAGNSSSLDAPRPEMRPAARSASNLPLPTSTSDSRPMSSTSRGNRRRSTEPNAQNQDGFQPSQLWNAQMMTAQPAESHSLASQLPSPSIQPKLHVHTFPIDSSRSQGSRSTVATPATVGDLPSNQPPIAHQPSTSMPLDVIQPGTKAVAEFSAITCRRCGASHVEYDLHYTCFRCDATGYSLCLRCYRQGLGCLHWFGFGWSAMQKYDRVKHANSSTAPPELPHILVARRFVRVEESTSAKNFARLTNGAAAGLQSGAFCDICQSFANDWYWHCDMCNDGEWGFCSSCVNQGRHCTHPLLPLTYQPDTMSSPSASYESQLLKSFVPKALNTDCDICRYPIPPSNSRYHCLSCNSGDYDMHLNCYNSLVKSGQISDQDGHNGWRRCLQGHRMVILGFEDRDGGQKRVVVRDRVGGDALREGNATAATHRMVSAASQNASVPTTPPAIQNNHTGWRWTDADGTSRFQSPNSISTSPSPMSNSTAIPILQFPPDGGIGARMVAKWGYFPTEPDELMFPRGAEIKETEDINGDWYWGVYAGGKGLFPGNYGRIIGRR